ncbi:hypothetical protein K254310026_18780 [Clostridium tetani]|nr:hypothetical protein K254310026_18780 [Clostridium tetani]SUY67044.1 Uncharacterised protein [Clostridium tetani]
MYFHSLFLNLAKDNGRNILKESKIWYNCNAENRFNLRE